MSQPTSKRPGAPFSGDPRDVYVAPADVNAGSHYVMYSVFSLDAALPGDAAERAAMVSEVVADVEASGATIRGWYDVAGFRADADLMVWLLAESPLVLQAAYHALRASSLGSQLVPVWSVIGTHRPAEFNVQHTPGCFSGIAPRPWITVYPFVRSYEWYAMDSAKRARLLKEHGMAARDYPDVIGSTTSSFGLGDYEWLLAFEADEPQRIVDAMRAARGVEARLHVREETPFFTGPRVELASWADAQPLA